MELCALFALCEGSLETRVFLKGFLLFAFSEYGRQVDVVVLLILCTLMACCWNNWVEGSYGGLSHLFQNDVKEEETTGCLK